MIEPGDMPPDPFEPHEFGGDAADGSADSEGEYYLEGGPNDGRDSSDAAAADAEFDPALADDSELRATWRDALPRGIAVPAEYLSRGTGEEVLLADTCVYDFMPPILGAQFMTVPALRQQAYFMGENGGPFLGTQRAYDTAARTSLRDGDITGALEAYKASLDAARSFSYGMSMLAEGLVALNEAEMNRLGTEQFAGLEGMLINALPENELVDMDAYRIFVREVARDTRRANKLYWEGRYRGSDSAGFELRADGSPEAEAAKECIGLYAKMRQFGTAVSVARSVGWDDVADYYAKFVPDSPRNTRRMDEAKRRIDDQRD